MHHLGKNGALGAKKIYFVKMEMTYRAVTHPTILVIKISNGSKMVLAMKIFVILLHPIHIIIQLTNYPR